MPADGSAPPAKVASGTWRGTPTGGGRGGRGGTVRVASPDGKWVARTQEKPQPRTTPTYASDFEKRHEERFKGVTFDWKDFQRDGAAFPAPNPAPRRRCTSCVRPARGRRRRKRSSTRTSARRTRLASGRKAHRVHRRRRLPQRAEIRAHRSLTVVDSTAGHAADRRPPAQRLDFSPDGKYLSYARSSGPTWSQEKLNHGGPRDLFVRPVEGAGRPINLTASWDSKPAMPTWSPDSRFMYFTAPTGGEVAPVPRRARQPGEGRTGDKGERRLGSLTFDRAITTIAYTVGVHDGPAEIYVANIDGSNERRLTRRQRRVRLRASRSARRTPAVAEQGRHADRGLALPPPGYDAARDPIRSIVFSHGGPHAATGYGFDFKKQFFAANGYFVLDTNFRSSTGYGEEFNWATWGAWGNKDGEDVIVGRRLRHRALSDRREARRTHRPFVRRLHDATG